MDLREKQLKYVQHICHMMDVSVSGLAKAAKKDSATLNKFMKAESGRQLSLSTIEALENISGIIFRTFGVTGFSEPKAREYDAGIKPNAKPVASSKGQEYAELPLYDARAAAGVGAWNQTAPDMLDNIPVDKAYLKSRGNSDPNQCFFIQAMGDSMYNPRKSKTIRDGDRLLVDRTQTVPLEGLVYALETSAGLIVKRLKIFSGSFHATSDSIENDKGERLQESTEILGRVISNFSIMDV